MKKSLPILAAFALIALAGCGPSNQNFKFGLICLHDTDSTYDKNFIDAFQAACAAKGVTPSITTGVPEDATVTTKAEEMADDGCKAIFADSFGHEDFLLNAAREFPNVQFYHATGTKAHTAGVANFHNAFASIYDGRYLAGVAAGLKLKAMKEADPTVASKVGYVGAFPYAEVVSGYTAWYLGVRSIVSDVTMEVTYTGSWYDEVGERDGASYLIDRGAVLISQHADSWGAPSICETKGVPNVSYNGSTESRCPNTFIVSSRINWQPYFEHIIDSIRGNTPVEKDYTGTLETGSVILSELGKKAPATGTQAKLDEVKAKLISGETKVFDCSTFTVGGAHLTSYLADVDDDGTFTGETEVILTDDHGVKYFAESKFRSAPYFDVRIDGITELSE